jgi:AcrR family transcriptional regulator
MAIKGQRTAAGEETRKEILDAALTLLGHGGLDAFSAGALAREVNVSKATIFHHFASVDEILLAACDWRRSLELEGHQPTTARAYLDGLGQQLVRAAQGDPVLLKAQAVFVTRAIFDREMNARLSEGVAEMHRLVVEALSARLPSNVSDAEIESIARLAEMALDGLMINLVMRTDEWVQFQHAWTLMVDLLLSGAKAG